MFRTAIGGRSPACRSRSCGTRSRSVAREAFELRIHQADVERFQQRAVRCRLCAVGALLQGEAIRPARDRRWPADRPQSRTLPASRSADRRRRSSARLRGWASSFAETMPVKCRCRRASSKHHLRSVRDQAVKHRARLPPSLFRIVRLPVTAPFCLAHQMQARAREARALGSSVERNGSGRSTTARKVSISAVVPDGIQGGLLMVT